LIRHISPPNGSKITGITSLSKLHNYDGKNAADIAYQAKHMEILSSLVEIGITPLLADIDGMTAIQYASKMRHRTLLFQLLSFPELNVCFQENSTQLVEYVLWEQDHKTLEVILSKLDSDTIKSIFLQACGAGQHFIVENLLSSGFINLRKFWRDSWEACSKRDYFHVGRTLIRHWCNLDRAMSNINSFDAEIMEATSSVVSAEAVRCLEVLVNEAWKEVSGNLIDSIAAFFLPGAIISKNFQMIEVLAKAGALKESSPRREVPPLFVAISTKNLAVVRSLLNHGASITTIFRNKSPLDWSIAQGSDNITELLRSKGSVKYQSKPRKDIEIAPGKRLSLKRQRLNTILEEPDSPSRSTENGNNEADGLGRISDRIRQWHVRLWD
jgi:ankyrin repeat protein